MSVVADSVLEIDKATVQRLTDAFNARDRAAFDGCYADTITVRGGGEEVAFTHE